MRDLGWVCTNSWRFGCSELPVGGFGSYDDLFAGYEAVSGQAVAPGRVKFWEVFGSFWWAIGCLGMAKHYRTGPDNTVERPAIGRRTSECQVDCVNHLIPGPVELVQDDGQFKKPALAPRPWPARGRSSPPSTQSGGTPTPHGGQPDRHRPAKILRLQNRGQITVTAIPPHRHPGPVRGGTRSAWFRKI